MIPAGFDTATTAILQKRHRRVFYIWAGFTYIPYIYLYLCWLPAQHTHLWIHRSMLNCFNSYNTSADYNLSIDLHIVLSLSLSVGLWRLSAAWNSRCLAELNILNQILLMTLRWILQAGPSSNQQKSRVDETIGFDAPDDGLLMSICSAVVFVSIQN